MEDFQIKNYFYRCDELTGATAKKRRKKQIRECIRCNKKFKGGRFQRFCEKCRVRVSNIYYSEYE